MKKVLIQNGPHAGVIEVRDVTETLNLVTPSDDPRRPATYQRYRQTKSLTDDFIRDIAARYEWVP